MTVSSPEQLEQSFMATEASGGAGHGSVRRRLLPDSALDVFTEVRFPSRDWALLVHSNEQMDDRDLLLATGLTCRTRNGSVEVVAGPETDRLLFCTLLADLVRQLNLPASAPTTALLRRLTAWRRMLGRGLPTGLTPEARIGLYGELLVLREVMLPAIGPAAVRAWVGPSSAPQDFRHSATAVEVKTVSRRDPDRCRISHERQLDSTGLARLFLMHQVVGTASEGASLGELVDELRDDPLVRSELSWFENCLLEAGWLDAHRDQYLNDRYVLTRRQYFAVSDGFPRMIPADLPPGVSGVSYLVDLSTCGPRRVDEGVVRKSVGGDDVAGE
jgi:hypothetical protein